MSYYYTVKEYASIKKFDLSLQDEEEVVAHASRLSNKLGVPVNQAYCRTSHRNIPCYASRILRQIFRALSDRTNHQLEVTLRV